MSKGIGSMSGTVKTTGSVPLPTPSTGGKPLRTTFGTRVYKGRGGR